MNHIDLCVVKRNSIDDSRFDGRYDAASSLLVEDAAYQQEMTA
jgi:hypothetical protein